MLAISCQMTRSAEQGGWQKFGEDGMSSPLMSLLWTRFYENWRMGC